MVINRVYVMEIVKKMAGADTTQERMGNRK
jgi:hypothetical protein